MAKLKEMLVKKLQTLEGFEDRPSKVSGGSAIFFQGKEMAHFHSQNEIDVRLTKKIIKSEGLSHPKDSQFHPKRGPSSEWIELQFRSVNQVEEIVRLFKLIMKTKA
jgi:hypothetical protein